MERVPEPEKGMLIFMNSNMMGDKERLSDGLLSQKQISSAYNTFAGECTNLQMRDEFLTILKEEHEIQSDIFNEMQSRGWYKVDPAEQTKVDTAKQKFTQM